MIDFKGHRYEREIILLGVRWYLAYPLRYRNLEERMAERGVTVDHTNVYHWVQTFTPLLEGGLRRGKKRTVGSSWRLDETYIKIKGPWKYLYRAVDKAGQTVDFLLTAHRDKPAALRFLKKAIGQQGRPAKVTIDPSAANTAALIALNTSTDADVDVDADADADANIEIRQRTYLNHLIEQDHRAVKRIIRPMLGFQTVRSARTILQGIELMHRIKKGQMHNPQGLSAADLFYSLAA